jgi:hypothetical protein
MTMMNVHDGQCGLCMHFGEQGGFQPGFQPTPKRAAHAVVLHVVSGRSTAPCAALAAAG